MLLRWNAFWDNWLSQTRQVCSDAFSVIRAGSHIRVLWREHIMKEKGTKSLVLQFKETRDEIERFCAPPGGACGPMGGRSLTVKNHWTRRYERLVMRNGEGARVRKLIWIIMYTTDRRTALHHMHILLQHPWWSFTSTNMNTCLLQLFVEQQLLTVHFFRLTSILFEAWTIVNNGLWWPDHVAILQHMVQAFAETDRLPPAFISTIDHAQGGRVSGPLIQDSRERLKHVCFASLNHVCNVPRLRSCIGWCSYFVII